MVQSVADANQFKQKLAEAGDKLVVVDFYAQWCGPCKMIAPKIEALAGTMNNVVFLKVDVDEAEDVAMDNKISCMPTFIFFKNSTKVDELSGANYEKFVELVNKHAWELFVAGHAGVVFFLIAVHISGPMECPQLDIYIGTIIS